MEKLGKHKFYCELCRKQCKDTNAYQQHKKSLFHTTKMNEFSERPEYFLQRYSDRFTRQFIEAVDSKASRGKWQNANQVYNDLIRDSKHVHLNATKWQSLTQFIKELCEKPDFESDEIEGQLHVIHKKNEPVVQEKVKLTVQEVKLLEKKREEKFIAKQIEKAQKS